MNTTASIEELLRQVLERLTRHERRVEVIEGCLTRGTPGPPRTPPPVSAMETPPEIPWPRRGPPPPGIKAIERVRELEARLAEAEERLRVANRLETVGRLVAGVAHDFNNLLTVISGNAEMLRSSLPADDELRTAINAIAATTQTAAAITRQLVALSRPGKPNTGPVDPNLAIRNLEPTLQRLTGERLTVEFFPAATAPLVKADPGQFDQVLLNLVVNGRDACVAQGTVTIRTAVVSVTSARPGWPADVPPGEFVAVTVTDTGKGMTPAVVARIFDPFFSTKGTHGTGLGLATVHDIVHATGGHIEVESSPEWGTHVRVFWPAFPEPKNDTLKVV